MPDKVEMPVQEDWDAVEGGLINDGSEVKEPDPEEPEQEETEQEEVEEETQETPPETEEETTEETPETTEESPETELDIEALKADAEAFRHLREVAEKNPGDFAEIVGKHFPSREVTKPVELDTKIIFNKDPDKTYTEDEIIAHINEANRSMVNSVLEERGLGGFLQEHHEKRLEGQFPYYKQDVIKKAARDFQKRMEVDPSGTMQELCIKAAGFDNMGDVIKVGKELARIKQKQKLAATGDKGVSPPKPRNEPKVKEPTREQAAVAAITGASPWGD